MLCPRCNENELNPDGISYLSLREGHLHICQRCHNEEEVIDNADEALDREEKFAAFLKQQQTEQSDNQTPKQIEKQEQKSENPDGSGVG